MPAPLLLPPLYEADAAGGGTVPSEPWAHAGTAAAATVNAANDNERIDLFIGHTSWWFLGIRNFADASNRATD
jgi:hypothetical protein